jgi:hypothetical protein
MVLFVVIAVKTSNLTYIFLIYYIKFFKLMFEKLQVLYLSENKLSMKVDNRVTETSTGKFFYPLHFTKIGI